MPAVEADVEIEGLDEFHNSLYSLDSAMRGQIAMDAIRDAMEPLPARFRAGINSRTGELSASIDVAYRRYQQGEVIAAYAGPTWPRGAHGRMVEEGTKQRYTREGYYRGIATAYPFIGPAVDEAALVDDIGQSLSAGIDREVAL